jgi:hypothetical protein
MAMKPKLRRFLFCEIQEVILGLIEKYNIEKGTSLTNLEFGFNLAVSKGSQNNHRQQSVDE